ncbi:hypothetical protein KEM55_001232 [Ascosphaera atra]|nr:hypothetical protein KEM55_001232 [Ascosphaera atra]
MSVTPQKQAHVKQAQYTHGHHPAVLRSHAWRTVANSAGYLLPHLEPSAKVLDVGCGPGTITIDLARYVPDGKVVGLEPEVAAHVLEQARKDATEKGVANVEFVTGDANALPFEDNTFDVVYCHQVLQHVGDPVNMLREMRRVAKAGTGKVAARETDLSAFFWFPQLPEMDFWQQTYLKVARGNGGEPDAGRQIHSWARQAGFKRENMTMSTSNWCYASKEEVDWWSNLWAERTLLSSFKDSAARVGVSHEDLERMANAWREWGKHEDAWFAIPSGEMVCRKE